jgi:hypothetical protein
MPRPSPSTSPEQCERANQTGRTPVVFVHGLWLLPSSWDRWAALFEDNGYVALTPGWRADFAPLSLRPTLCRAGRGGTDGDEG